MHPLVEITRAAGSQLWQPVRQAGLLTCLQPDWTAAPRHIPGLAAYAGVLLGALAARHSLVGDTPLLDALSAAVGAFLAYVGRTALFVAFYTFAGYYLVRWQCVARTASPFALMGLAMTVSTVDQSMLVAIGTWTEDTGLQATLLGMRELVTVCLGIFVLIDYFRPRPPRKRRPASKEARSTFAPSTRPAA